MFRCHIAAALLSAVLLFAASPLHAQGGSSAPLQLAQDEQAQWYGWQILALDAAAIAAVAYGATQEDPLALSTGIAAYALAAPSIHLANHQSGKAGTSLLLRVVTPVTLGLVGGLISTLAGSGDDQTVLLYAAPGALLGGLIAIVIDNTRVADVDSRPWFAGAPRAW